MVETSAIIPPLINSRTDGNIRVTHMYISAQIAEFFSLPKGAFDYKGFV